MLKGIEKIREGSFTLREESKPTKERLKQAGPRLQQAMLDPLDWPEELRIRAEHLTEALHADGSIEETIDHMDEQAAEKLLRGLADFADAAELSDENIGQGQGGGRPPT